MLQQLGCEVSDLGIVPDDRARTRAAFAAAAATADLIITSGGVSVGEEDHVRPAVEAEGALELWQIAMKPGKPVAFGRVREVPFIGLPGNPVSSFVTFLLFARPFVLKCQGVREVDPPAYTTARRLRLAEARPAPRVPARATQRSAGSGSVSDPELGGAHVDRVGRRPRRHPRGSTVARGDVVRYLSFADLRETQPMKVTILYFAALRERVGRAREVCELPSEVGNVGALRDWLVARGGRWTRSAIPHACEPQWSEAWTDTVLHDGAEWRFSAGDRRLGWMAPSSLRFPSEGTEGRAPSRPRRSGRHEEASRFATPRLARPPAPCSGLAAAEMVRVQHEEFDVGAEIARCVPIHVLARSPASSASSVI